MCVLHRPFSKSGHFFAISMKRVTVSVPVSKFTLFIRTRSTLHVKGRNGGIGRYCRLVCLTVQHFHSNVQCEEDSACSAKVFFGRAFHAGSSVSYLSKINS